MHHGRIPRALSQFVVRSFDKNLVDFVICTSTLIEGVNTKARNVVIYDNQINKARFDYFTFNNIKGRSGRMWKHFVGNVFLFHAAPEPILPMVDMQAFSQPEATPESLLIQLEDEDLTAESKARIQGLRQQTVLSYETLKANIGIDPEAQVRLANYMLDNYQTFQLSLSWKTYPTTEQLKVVCELMWTFLGGSKKKAGAVLSANQLAYRIGHIRRDFSIPQLIKEEIEFLATKTDNPSADLAVQRVLDFLRNWACFHFPRFLRAIDRIQREVFSRSPNGPGNYDLFATKVEHLFMDSALFALDEYGIPYQLAQKLENKLKPEGDLDYALNRLKEININNLDLSPFEFELMKTAQAGIGRV